MSTAIAALRSPGIDASVPRAALRTALERAARVVGKRPLLPILSRALLVCEGSGDPKLYATDLEVTLRAPLGAATVHEYGSALIDVRAALAAVKASKTDWCGVVAGPDGLCIDGVRCGAPDSMEEYPTLAFRDDVLGWNRVGFQRGAWGRLAAAASTDETRYNLNAIRVEADAHSVQLVATDGHRMHLTELDVATGSSRFEVSIPKPGLLARMIGGRETSIRLAATEDFAFVELDDSTVLRLKAVVDGEFPNWRAVVPKREDAKTLLVIDAAELAGLATLATGLGATAVTIRAAGDCERLALDFKTSVGGETLHSVRTAVGHGPGIERLILDIGYLRAAAEHACPGADGELILRVVDPLSPVTVMSYAAACGGQSAIVMPMRI